MSVKLLTEHHLEFLSLKEAALSRLSLHLSKCHIVGNHVSWLNYTMNIGKPDKMLKLPLHMYIENTR